MKPERIQERLMAMPRWRYDALTETLVRRDRFERQTDAIAHLIRALEADDGRGPAPRVEVVRGEVTVTVGGGEEAVGDRHFELIGRIDAAV